MTSPAANAMKCDLAIVLIASDEASNLAFLLPELTQITRELGIRAGVIVVFGGEGKEAARVGAVPAQAGCGHDAEADVLRDLWAARDRAGCRSRFTRTTTIARSTAEIPLQRYWQRARHRIICGFAAAGGRTLDVG